MQRSAHRGPHVAQTGLFGYLRRPVIPARSTAEMWTNMSFPPSSGAMKPYPFVVLNHFTVPVAIPVFPTCLFALRRLFVAPATPAASLMAK